MVTRDWTKLAASAGLLTLVGAAIWKSRKVAEKDRYQVSEVGRMEREVDLSSMDSIPASDPPAWTGTHA